MSSLTGRCTQGSDSIPECRAESHIQRHIAGSHTKALSLDELDYSLSPILQASRGKMQSQEIVAEPASAISIAASQAVSCSLQQACRSIDVVPFTEARCSTSPAYEERAAVATAAVRWERTSATERKAVESARAKLRTV